MTIQSFIEKAIEGGWRPKGTLYKEDFMDAHILDPEMWKAVGKVEGWSKGLKGYSREVPWRRNMHRMVDALAEGKSIEEFLATL
jgi:hypothetical protein